MAKKPLANGTPVCSGCVAEDTGTRLLLACRNEIIAQALLRDYQVQKAEVLPTKEEPQWRRAQLTPAEK